MDILVGDKKGYLGISVQDNYGYVKDNTKGYWEGYLCRISGGYLKDMSGYLFKISLEDMSKKDILNLQRYPEISLYILTYP